MFSYTVTSGGVTETANINVPVTAVNDAPVVASPIADTSVNEDTAWSYAIPAGSFTDVDSVLTYTATLSSGAALPSWVICALVAATPFIDSIDE